MKAEEIRLAPIHGHGHHGPHGPTHGVVDATIATTYRGIWAIKWSFVILAAAAAMQIVVVALSGSVALLADTIHNVADATTAIPLWIAFAISLVHPLPFRPGALDEGEHCAASSLMKFPKPGISLW